MASDMTLVVYMGGSCGDLITSMLDLQDSSFDSAYRKMQLPQQRQRLKKPHTFANDQEKDQYLDQMVGIYTSIPSHDLDYHVRRGHDFIGIRVQDPDIALWAARRFQHAHRPEVWQSVAQGWNISSPEQYAQLLIDYGGMISSATDKLLELEDIISGHVVPCLEHLIGRKLDTSAVNCYRNWLAIQNGTFVC
jgi:hypothetical protein